MPKNYDDGVLQANATTVLRPWTRWAQPFRHLRAPDAGRSLPTFFIVGPPRTGTSWLHEVLKRRAALPAFKETRFFDEHFHRGLGWYRSKFLTAKAGHRVGEVAPTYFASTQARGRIRELIPAAKIVCVFRDPIQRMISLYRLKRAYGWISWNFEQAIQRDPELTESNRYATYLKAWQQTFGAEQVLPTFFEDLRDHSQAYMDRLADFIGIPRFTLSAAEYGSIHASDRMTLPRSYHRTRTARLMVEWLEARHLGSLLAYARKSPLHKFVLGGGPTFADLPCEVSRELFPLFREEVEELERMLERDLSAWKPSDAGSRAEQAAA